MDRSKPSRRGSDDGDLMDAYTIMYAIEEFVLSRLPDRAGIINIIKTRYRRVIT